MKLTLTNVKKLKKDATPLEKAVWDYIILKWYDYDNKNNTFTDVLYYGCQSGIVSSLVYYADTAMFYKKYKSEINGLLYNIMSETGIYSLPELFGEKWDNEDPLAENNFNRNLLAWFGFEETLRKIASNFEELDELI